MSVHYVLHFHVSHGAMRLSIAVLSGRLKPLGMAPELTAFAEIVLGRMHTTASC